LDFIDVWTDGVGLIHGLDGAHDVAVSPTDEMVVAAGLLSGSVVAFWRDRASGRLGFAQAELDSVQDGLDGARGVAVSPDARHVFVAGQSDDALVVFAPEAGRIAAFAAACLALASRARRGRR
jgi:6-phosphogluconolactonase (cycloisomerase 2 family)